MHDQAKLRLAYSLGLIAILVAGYFWYHGATAGYRRETERELIRNNELAIAAINTDRYAGLSFSEADNQHPDYQRLRQQFMDLHRVMREEDGIRVIYAMRVVGDEIRFIVDSSALGDPNHSEPGVVYREPPQVLLDVIRDGQPRSGGPYTDEYGSFYSAFALQKDREGRIVAYMGTDVETADFGRILKTKQRPAVFGTAALLLSYLVVMLLLDRWLVRRGRKAEEILALRRRTDGEDRLLMNISEGIITYDSLGKVVFANRAAVDSVCQGSTSCAAQEHDRHWLLTDEQGRLLPPERQPTAVGFAASVAAEPDGVRRGFMKRFNGQAFPVVISAVRFDSGDGNKQTVVTFRDITQEAEMDQTKSDFISVAVHQLRTPLTALKWSVELLAGAQKKWTAEEADSVGRISAAAEQLNDLVTALLNVGRLESGRLRIEPRPTDLGELAAVAVKDVAHLSGAKKHEVSLVVAAGLPRIGIDPRLIREAYKNLLTNAVKYTPTGGRIEIRVEAGDGGIVSSVKDNGFGIPARDKNRIFGRFFRASNVTNLPEEGTGLGLYLVRMIVETSGGRVWFESTEGVGSTFYFSLPLSGTAARTGDVEIG